MDIEVISQTVKKIVEEMNLSKPEYTVKSTSLTLDLATILAKEVELEAKKRKMKIVVCVANASGNPVLVHAMDDSFIASYKIAVDKAYTSVALKMPTKKLAVLAGAGGSLFGINQTDSRIVIFGGGEPLEYNGEIIGAVAVSGGTADEDTSLGEFAKNKFKELISWQLTKK